MPTVENTGLNTRLRMLLKTEKSLLIPENQTGFSISTVTLTVLSHSLQVPMKTLMKDQQISLLYILTTTLKQSVLQSM